MYLQMAQTSDVDKYYLVFFSRTIFSIVILLPDFRTNRFKWKRVIAYHYCRTTTETL